MTKAIKMQRRCVLNIAWVSPVAKIAHDSFQVPASRAQSFEANAVPYLRRKVLCIFRKGSPAFLPADYVMGATRDVRDRCMSTRLSHSAGMFECPFIPWNRTSAMAFRALPGAPIAVSKFVK